MPGICVGGVSVAQGPFQVPGGGSTPTSTLQLLVRRIDTESALDLNAIWHSRLPRMGRGCIKIPFPSYGAFYGPTVYAIAIWSNPVARLLPQREWFELRRLAISPEAPRNTASRMLGVMARLIHVERPHVTTLCSYQDTEVHTGGIYKAAGWTLDNKSSGDEWNRPGRSRPKAQSAAPKNRWIKILGAQDG